MTWGARAGRTAVLSLLAVTWAVLAHGLALPHAAAPGEGMARLLGDLPLVGVLWAAASTVTTTWWLAPVGQGRRGPRAAAVGAALGLGQLITHGCLSLSPLLAGQVLVPAGAIPSLEQAAAGGHAHHLGTVTGSLSATDVLGALAHGGAAMLLAHVAATAAAAVAWAMLGALLHLAGGWWARVRPVTVDLAPLRTSRVLGTAAARPRWSLSLSWSGRAPPVPAR